MPSFGAIKALQARTGADRAACKKALIDHADDEDAAAAALGEASCVPASSAGSSSSSSENQRALDAGSSGSSENQRALDAWAAEEQASSVSIVRQEVGDGVTFPATGDTLTMHYVGTLEDGTVFDSSRQRNKPFTFKIGCGKVIKGWDVGVMKMSLGEKAGTTASDL
jgi:FK506-binding protein 1